MLLILLPIGKPRGISVRFVVNRLIVFRNVFRVRTQATLQSTFATHLAGISPWARRRSASRLIKANNMDLLISLLLPSVYNRTCCRLSRYLLVYVYSSMNYAIGKLSRHLRFKRNLYDVPRESPDL